MNNEDITAFVGEYKNRVHVCENRILNLEQQTVQMQDLVLSVKELAFSMKNMTEEQKEQSVRIKKLENEPAERWNSMQKTAFTTIVGVIAGALAMGLMNLITQYL